MSQSPPVPMADDVGPRPGEGLYFIPFWLSELSTCFTEVLPYSSALPAGQYVKGSWCGVSRRRNNFFFLFIMLSMVSQPSLPLIAGKCPDALVFLLGSFHFSRTNQRLCPAVFGVAFPQWKRRECLMLGGRDPHGESSHPTFPRVSPASASLASWSLRDWQHPAPGNGADR